MNKNKLDNLNYNYGLIIIDCSGVKKHFIYTKLNSLNLN